MAQHVRLAQLAAQEQAQVVVFPELSLTGYELDLADELAFMPNDARLEPLVEAAERQGLTLVVGAPARIGERLHIGAFIVCPGGTVELYTKQRLGAFPSSASADGVVPAAEATVFEPGTLNPLVRFGVHSAAVAVCADVCSPSHARQAARRGATAYLASMFVIPSEFAGEAAKLKERAARQGMTVVFANHGGPTGGLMSGGGSAIWSETGELLVRWDGLGAGLVVARESDVGWIAGSLGLDGG